MSRWPRRLRLRGFDARNLVTPNVSGLVNRRGDAGGGRHRHPLRRDRHLRAGLGQSVAEHHVLQRRAPSILSSRAVRGMLLQRVDAGRVGAEYNELPRQLGVATRPTRRSSIRRATC